MSSDLVEVVALFTWPAAWAALGAPSIGLCVCPGDGPVIESPFSGVPLSTAVGGPHRMWQVGMAGFPSRG